MPNHVLYLELDKEYNKANYNTTKYDNYLQLCYVDNFNDKNKNLIPYLVRGSEIYIERLDKNIETVLSNKRNDIKYLNAISKKIIHRNHIESDDCCDLCNFKPTFIPTYEHLNMIYTVKADNNITGYNVVCNICEMYISNGNYGGIIKRLTTKSKQIHSNVITYLSTNDFDYHIIGTSSININNSYNGNKGKIFTYDKPNVSSTNDEFEGYDLCLDEDLNTVSTTKTYLTNSIDKEINKDIISIISNLNTSEENPFTFYTDASKSNYSKNKSDGVRVGVGGYANFNDKKYYFNYTEKNSNIIKNIKSINDSSGSPSFELSALYTILDLFRHTSGKHITIMADFEGCLNYGILHDYSSGEQRSNNKKNVIAPNIKYIINEIESILNNNFNNKLSIKWVKGHSGVDGNEMADKLATGEIETIQDAIPLHAKYQ